MVLPVLLVNPSMMDLGEPAPVALLVRKPSALSDVLPLLPKLYTPPPAFEAGAVEACVVASVPVVQLVTDDDAVTLKPEGNVAVAELPMPSKLCVYGKVVMETCAQSPPCVASRAMEKNQRSRCQVLRAFVCAPTAREGGRCAVRSVVQECMSVGCWLEGSFGCRKVSPHRLARIAAGSMLRLIVKALSGEDLIGGQRPVHAGFTPIPGEHGIFRKGPWLRAYRLNAAPSHAPCELHRGAPPYARPVDGPLAAT